MIVLKWAVFGSLLEIVQASLKRDRCVLPVVLDQFYSQIVVKKNVLQWQTGPFLSTCVEWGRDTLRFLMIRYNLNINLCSDRGSGRPSRSYLTVPAIQQRYWSWTSVCVNRIQRWKHEAREVVECPLTPAWPMNVLFLLVFVSWFCMCEVFVLLFVFIRHSCLVFRCCMLNIRFPLCDCLSVCLLIFCLPLFSKSVFSKSLDITNANCSKEERYWSAPSLFPQFVRRLHSSTLFFPSISCSVGCCSLHVFVFHF